MNGAELPSGNVLHVEPASSNSSSDACSQQQSPYGPPTNAVGGGVGGDVKVKDETPAQADDDEDLDDFFDSL